MEVSDQLHDPAALLPGKWLQYPLDRRLGIIWEVYHELYFDIDSSVGATVYFKILI
jgi:hypothetical protein